MATKKYASIHRLAKAISIYVCRASLTRTCIGTTEPRKPAGERIGRRSVGQVPKWSTTSTASRSTRRRRCGRELLGIIKTAGNATANKKTEMCILTAQSSYLLPFTPTTFSNNVTPAWSPGLLLPVNVVFFRATQDDAIKLGRGATPAPIACALSPLHSAPQARIDRPVDKRRASHPLPLARLQSQGVSRVRLSASGVGTTRRHGRGACSATPATLADAFVAKTTPTP